MGYKHVITIAHDGVEALREVLRGRRATPAEIGAYTQIDRVANVMQPYVEALIS